MSAERYSGQPVLVTGGDGFVGCWLVERLLDQGARVLVPHREDPPDSRFRTEGIDRRCDTVWLDLTDHASVLRVLNEHEIKAVFHLAAQASIGTANRSALLTWESNVRGTYTLLEACRSATAVSTPLERIVVASSRRAYGDHDAEPYREELPLRARHPYDVSKACADLIARSYATTYELPVAVPRLTNVYGGGDINFSRLVPNTAAALARGERPILRSDGSPERDWIYVEDAVEAYMLVAESLDRPELRGRAWNAGTGEAISVLDLVRALTRVAGNEVEPDVRGQGAPRAEIDRQVLDSSAIREELGWEPRVDLETGLRRTWEWYESYLTGQP